VNGSPDRVDDIAKRSLRGQTVVLDAVDRAQDQDAEVWVNFSRTINEILENEVVPNADTILGFQAILD
jgi:hypothetical protein